MPRDDVFAHGRSEPVLPCEQIETLLQSVDLLGDQQHDPAIHEENTGFERYKNSSPEQSDVLGQAQSTIASMVPLKTRESRYAPSM